MHFAFLFLLTAILGYAQPIQPFDCGYSNFVINPSGIVADFNINCNLDAMSSSLVDRTGRYTTIAAGMIQPTGAGSTLLIVTSPLSIPVDTRISVMPIVTYEMVIEVGPFSESNFSFLFSSDNLSNIQSAGAPARTLLAYESNGSGASIVPRGSTPYTGGKAAAITSNLIHVVVSYDNSKGTTGTINWW